MTDIATWLGQQLDEDGQGAHDARHDLDGVWTCVERSDHSLKVVDSLGYSIAEDEEADSAPWWTLPHIARHDPASVLRRVAADRAILAEVASWQHDYVDGDSWLSCAQAVDPHDEDGVPGSGCADEKRRGGPCECGLERRRNAILHPLAQSYDERPGFKDEWRL